ncbi:tail length tape-measure protein [Pectobacterium phage DU_PP_V]|uniref:Tail length tape-measure protein n=1 Tax=Pectobacterium phage DU_PP_V TaxID=2041492 RepID=A0A2D2W719_9CAUD|nr:tail length tape measure protein [Pectobacterium phage DU_PP_V]ATS94096.1 tail length tape-measure protein [Pectobacterium phage DU_PP_V]
MATDKLIRELLINVKQQGATKVTKTLNSIVDGLQDAAAGAELTNEQLNKLPKTLMSIEKAADRAGRSLGKVAVTRGMGAINTTLTQLANKIDDLSLVMIELADVTKIGFEDMVKSSRNMSNNVGRSIERVEDGINDLHRTTVRAGQGLDGMGNNARRASRALGDTSGSSRGLTRDFAAMAKVGGTLPILYAAIASNIFVLQSAFEQLKLGDQLNRLEQFGSIVGTTTGTPVQSLAIALQEAVGYAVSYEEAMRQASSASAYGFDSTQLEQFGLVARRAAAVLGVDMTDALNRVIKGVSKQEIELLDELGVTIRLNDAYATYVNRLNAANTGLQYNMNSLSTFQKQQAYANAVIEESTKRFGHLDKVLRATPWEQFAATADSALRKIQQSAASFLGPTIASINAVIASSQAEGSISAAIAQQNTNRQVNSSDTGAVALSLSSSQKGYSDALSRYREALAARNKLQDEYNKAYEKASYLGRVAIDQVGQGIPVSLSAAAGTSKENQAAVETIAMMGHQLTAANKEIQDSTEDLGAWNRAVELAGEKAKQASPELQQFIGLTRDMDTPGASVDFNSTALANVADAVKEYQQIQKTSQDINSDIQNVAQSTDTAGKAAQSLSNVVRVIEDLSKKTGQNMDTLVANLKLGVNSMSELKAQSTAITNYSKNQLDDSKHKLEVEQEIAKVYKETGSKDKATAAGRALEIKQLQQQQTYLQAILDTNKGNKALEKEIIESRYEQLKLQNQGMEADKKTKDRRDKYLGVEEQIALLNNRTMTAQQYKVAQLNTELAIEQKKLDFYSKQKDKLAEHEQTRQRIAQLEREQWENRMSMQNTTTANQEREMQLAQRQRGSTGQAANLQENLDYYTRRKEQLKGNSEAQAELAAKIRETSVAMSELRVQREREMQSMVGSSLGATYTPTTGLTGEDKEFADMQNKMASYDQAISKMSELNSEATAVGQSLGNLTNSVMQFSQGSLDMTSMVAAGMQSVSSMIQYSTSNQVSAIDAAIAAEQKRDGKSEESKAKIKRLEAEKVKIQQDAAKKQIIIQTAVAVMQAATSVPYPWSIPLMVAAGLAGALALAQASNASSMSSIGDSSSDTASSLSLGERQKNIDVSMSANQGELSYIRGEKGIGNANTFVPRAEGGNMYPGVSYGLGEHGMEVATPLVPMKVTPAEEVSRSGSGPAIGNLTLQLTAFDALSLKDYLANNSDAVRNAVEQALNEQGTSLDRLNR